jgi:hypothetical protein
MFIKNVQGGILAFAHLFLLIWDYHIPYEVFWVVIASGIVNRPTT